MLWYFASRWCALAVDQVYTPRLAILNNAPVGWNGTWLQVGTGFFDKVLPNGYRADFTGCRRRPMRMRPVLPNGYRADFTGMGPDYRQIARFIVDADDRLVFVKDDVRFVLGPHAGTLPDPTLPDGEKPMPAFAPVSGDTMSAAIDKSLLSWPAPLIQLNFMGYAPSWQRTIYQRFSWTKPSGARLDILWRYRQDYDGVNGWTGMMLNDLIRIELRPATGAPIVWVEG